MIQILIRHHKDELEVCVHPSYEIEVVNNSDSHAKVMGNCSSQLRRTAIQEPILRQPAVRKASSYCYMRQ